MKVWAVLPVKRFDAAKSRLEGVLDAPSRALLARALFEHVFGVLRASADVAGITVITNSHEIEEAATLAGAIALRDPPLATTLGKIVDHALADVACRTGEAAVVFMSDLPELTPSDVLSITLELERADVVLVRDVRGPHTNALGLRRSTRLPTCFGEPDSFERHTERAARAGLSVARPDVPGIAFDVDTPEDYARMTGEQRHPSERSVDDAGGVSYT